jgi:hypothetical protein
LRIDIKKITKLLVSKRWEAASELFSKIALPLRIEFCEASLPSTFTGVEWVLRDRESCIFVFNQSLHRDQYQFALTRLTLLLPLICSFHSSKYFNEGNIFINLGDWADVAGLALCSSREDSILIPDTDFLSMHGYLQSRLDFLVNSPPWDMRASLAFWRGTTTGVRVDDSWRELPRLKLCEIANRVETQSIFDVGVSSFAQVSKKEAREIQAAGYLRNYIPIILSSKYKYQIDIDGNSNAWAALFQKLLSGSVVIKVASPGNFRQWYYDELIPWINYVPVKSDMSDLVEKIHWLIDHDDEAREIGMNGKKLASKLTYDEELNKTLININKALK